MHNVLTIFFSDPAFYILSYTQYDPQRTTIKGWSAMSASLYLAYIAFFAYVCWSVHRMDALHSRLGVTFTALVEIAVSTITSLSVCALVGFRITMVPWSVLSLTPIECCISFSDKPRVGLGSYSL